MTSTISPLSSELYNTVDYSSLSNCREVVSTNISLQWHIDFQRKVFSGSVEHRVKVLVAGSTEVSFDSSKLHIEGATLNGEAADFVIADTHAVLGTKISVKIPEALRAQDSTFNVRFQYSIDPAASAVQWLEASATKGGQHPFVFTQCQAIHARSLLPCQDSPGVKTTYDAVVTAPQWCTVLMSALADGSSTEGDITTCRWKQPVPTPAYLIALAAGNLASKDVSDRVRIWAEPQVIDSARYEFDETEEFVKTAEEITGCPYQWTRYDVLCMPPSFPYGGTENVCLTFATPTLLAGDRSLADVIAHEIAHSWTGNLVTNATWDHFWLNEGWTVWLERKITSKFKKNDEVGRLSAQIGYKHLKDDIGRMGSENKFTRLIWPLHGEDPDIAYSSVPYEKGFNLLYYLESIIGSIHFEGFVKCYIEAFKSKPVTSGEFKDCFVQYVHSNMLDYKLVRKQVDKIDWEDLFLSSGMPKYVPDFSNSLSAAAEQLAKNWIAFAESGAAINACLDDIKGWSSQQICLFLEALLNHTQDDAPYPFSVSFLEALDQAYGLNARKNSEIMLRWHSLCLRSDAEWIVPHVVQFITSQGRMKFVRPLYRALKTSKVGGKLADKVFGENKDIYHPIARKMVEADLKRLGEQQLAEEDEDNEEFGNYFVTETNQNIIHQEHNDEEEEESENEEENQAGIEDEYEDDEFDNDKKVIIDGEEEDEDESEEEEEEEEDDDYSADTEDSGDEKEDDKNSEHEDGEENEAEEAVDKQGSLTTYLWLGGLLGTISLGALYYLKSRRR